MSEMMITYVVTAVTGIFSVGSIVYFIKNKRFIGRSFFSTIASIIVFCMGAYASIKGMPLTQLQALIENMFK